MKKKFVMLYSRGIEIYWRVLHAFKILRKRFFTLAVKGHVELDSEFGFEEKLAEDRGYPAPDGKYYSKSYRLEWTQLPESVKTAIRNYDSVLRMYLGDGYLINKANVWRNYAIPQQYRNTELFSQHWHYDKVKDYRNIQFFVLIADIDEDQGPFEFISDPDEKNLIPTVHERNNADHGHKTQRLTGKRGDTLLFSTGSTPHRAGVPKEGKHRDILSIAFFPAYTKIGFNSDQLLDDIK